MPVKGVKGAFLHNKRMMVSELSRCEGCECWFRDYGVGCREMFFRLWLSAIVAKRIAIGHSNTELLTPLANRVCLVGERC